MNRPFLHSIRWHVQIWHGVILLLVIAAFCVLAIQFAWTNRLRQVDNQIRIAARVLLFEIVIGSADEPGEDGPAKFDASRIEELATRLREGTFVLPALIAGRFNGTAPGYSFFALHDGGGRILFRTSNTPPDFTFTPRLSPGIDDELRTSSTFRQSAGFLPEGVGFVFARDIQPDLEGARRFAWTLSSAGLALWVAGLLGGGWLAGRAIRPIEKISQTAARIAEGDLGERISTTGMVRELRDLSLVLNDTFERLRRAFERQKQFTGDASHELRTPLAIILSETQRVLKKDRTPAEYQEALHACREAATRMNRLVEDLLLLARHDGSTPLHLEDTDLATIATETLRQLQPLAQARGISLENETTPARFRGDPGALGIVLTNLIGNAVQHHDKASGRVKVSTSCTAAEAICTVEDDGPGIAAADLPHLFERFFRADRARTASGHSGLGLAIAKSLVEQHGGTLAAESTVSRGSRFTVTLPRSTLTTPASATR